MFCTKCGLQIPDGESCPNCSTVDSIAAQPVPNSVAPQQAPAYAAPQQASTYVAPQQVPVYAAPDNIPPNKKSGGIFYCLTSIDANFKYLFCAVFILLAGFVPKSLYMALTGGPVPTIIILLSNILLFLGFCTLMVIYSTKESKTSEKIFSKNIINTIINTAFVWVLLMAVYSLFGYIYYALSGTLTDAIANKNPVALFILAGFAVLLIILEIGIIATVAFYYVLQKRGAGISKTGKLFFTVLGSLLKKPLMTLVLCIFLTVALILGKEIFSILNSSLGIIIPYSFLSILAGCIFVALFNAYVMNVFFNAGRIILSRTPGMLQVSEKKGSSIPVFPIIILVPVIIALLFFNNTTSDPYKTLLNEVNNQINEGDILLETGLDLQSSDEYMSAYSKILAVRGYFTEIMKKQNTASSVSGTDDFKKATQIDPSNSLVPLFQGNIYYMNKDYNNALSVYKEGMKNPKSHPDFFMNGYMASRKISSAQPATTTQKSPADQKIQNDLNTQTGDFLHWLINNEVYTNSWMGFADYNINKLESYIIELKDLEKQVEPKLASNYYSYVYKGEDQKAAASLEELKKKYPDDPQICYYLSMVYTEYRSETNNYANSVANVEAFLKNTTSDGITENDKQKELYAASVYTMANQNDKAEAIYKKWYTKDNKDYETAEKYIYVLNQNKKYDEAMKVIASIESNGYKSANLVNYHAVTLLNQNMFADSIKYITKIKDYESKHDETYDRILYSYSLAASVAIKSDEDLKQLENIKDSILYPYINAMYKWRLKDSTASNEFLAQVLAKDNKLGYAWYCSGINYYEKAVRENTGDFKKAIECYQKSIAIVPDHVETYFALGHCFKKAGMLQEALNAFRKTVDLLPYEDHRTDPYGMTVHAQGVINELINALPKEVK